MSLSSNKFVIIGAGPVGLWSAIQTKKRFPESSVVIYEKYTTYNRNHILKIQHSSLFFGASGVHGELDEIFFKDVFGKSRKEVKKTPFSKTFVSTSTIEAGLKNWATSLSCEIRYRNIENLDEIISEHGEDCVFILANGAHSNLRTILLGDDDIEKTDLQYILELKSMLCNTSKELKAAKANVSIKKKLKNLAFEYIGKAKNNKTPLSLRIFVCKNLYDAVPDATFKSPIVNHDVLPLDIKNDLSNYAKIHHLSIDDLFKEGQITKLQLSVYHARKFSSNYSGVNFFLAGDAAMGVPYFRALNSGLVLASRLASILRLSDSSDRAADLYNLYQKVHQKAEESLAKGKNNGIKTYDEIRKIYRMCLVRKET